MANTKHPETPDGRPDAAIEHGGSLAEARLLFPDTPAPWIDLSTGINPIPYPLPEMPAARFTRLPEPAEIQGLERVAAEAYGAKSADQVASAPGTQSLIGLIAQVYAVKDVTILGPTYGEHAPAWAAAGAKVTEVSAPSDLRGAAAVLCNPNNPDGRVLAAKDVLEIATRITSGGGVTIVDEAFADLEDGNFSVAAHVEGARIIVLRSFGKTYGLAGVRLGFAIAAPELLAPIRAALGPWPVSGPALEFGAAALADSEWRKRTAERLSRDITTLDSMLKKSGLDILGGTRLFRLASSERAPEYFQNLGESGIYFRRFGDRPNLLRFGIPANAAEWDRLAASLASM